MSENQYGILEASIRHQSGKGSARKLRAKGLIPGIIYGKGEDNIMLTVSPRELRRALDPERKLNTFFKVSIRDGEGTPKIEECVLTNYQADPIRDEFVHVDFLRVDPNTEIVTKIPVEYIGRAVGVVTGGKLRTYQRTTRIAAKPSEMPVKLTVDITDLNVGDTLRMRDLELENARLLDHPDAVVAHVELPRAAMPEGEGEGKGEGEGEGEGKKEE